jgi:N-acyl-D-aspartate/D-glutamate deacylase
LTTKTERPPPSGVYHTPDRFSRHRRRSEPRSFERFSAYAERLRTDPAPVNTVALIGHMSLRVEAMQGDVGRAATDRECEQMRRRLATSLNEGASGFSTGLYYGPSAQAPTQEVIAVAEALRAQRGLYVIPVGVKADPYPRRSA